MLVSVWFPASHSHGLGGCWEMITYTQQFWYNTDSYNTDLLHL